MAKKTHTQEDASAFVQTKQQANEKEVKPNQIELDGNDFSLDDFLSEDISEEQKEEAERAILSGDETIELPLGRNNALIKFVLHIFEAHEIGTKTKPHDENIRNSKFFTELDRRVAKQMIAESGCNLYPALGVLNQETGITELYDGFRRSVGCEEFGVPLKAYVTTEPIAPQKAHKLSRNANDHVSNGLLDLREAYRDQYDHIVLQRKAENKPELSQNDVIKEMELPKATFIVAKQSFDVPDSIYMLFPSPTTLGRESLKAIRKEIVGRNLSDSQIETVIEKMGSYVKDHLGSMTINTVAENNKALKAFKEVVQQVKPATVEPIGNRFELPSKMGKVSLNAKGEVSISLKSLTQESLEALQSQLKAMLEDAE